MIEATYDWQPDRIPETGKDHLTLADWRMSVPSKHSLTGGGEGGLEEKRGVIEYEVTRADGSLQRVVLESGAKTPLPINDDDMVLIALLTLNDLAGHPEVLWFEVSHILALLRRPDNPFNVRKVKRAIERFQRMSSSFEGVWFSRKEKKVLPSYDTGVIAESGCVSKAGRRKKGERLSHVQWTKSFHESLLEGNLINIDLVVLSQWKRPGAMQLYRHLNKVWRGGRKPFVYERDLEELACGHLLMSRTKDTKRNFTAILRELEGGGFLCPLDTKERFSRSNGSWRVRLEIQTNSKSSPAIAQSNNEGKSTEAQQLVRMYHHHRFGTTDHCATSKEVACANRLLVKADLNNLLKLTPVVASIVKKALADDLYFGFAERHYQQALQQQKRRKTSRDQRLEVGAIVDKKVSDTTDVELDKQARRQRLLTTWQRQSAEKQARCVERALQRNSSHSYRNRILDSSMENPAAEVLNELERTHSSLSPVLTNSRSS